MGTGLVMSVPAHAPKDYQALMDLKAKNHELASKLEPIPIIQQKDTEPFLQKRFVKRWEFLTNLMKS